MPHLICPRTAVLTTIHYFISLHNKLHTANSHSTALVLFTLPSLPYLSVIYLCMQLRPPARSNAWRAMKTSWEHTPISAQQPGGVPNAAWMAHTCMAQASESQPMQECTLVTPLETHSATHQDEAPPASSAKSWLPLALGDTALLSPAAVTDSSAHPLRGGVLWAADVIIVLSCCEVSLCTV